MRDDLHRTVPLPRPWRTVLKYVSREVDESRAIPAMSRAIHSEINAGLSHSWTSSFKRALEASGADLFSQERVLKAFDDLEDKAATRLERQLCELSRGIYARDKTVSDLFAKSLDALRHQITRSNVEHPVSVVRSVHGRDEAAQVRPRLDAVARACTFHPPQHRSRREKSKDSVLDLLNEPVRLKVQ